jgi:hypothetical protein
MFKTSGAKAKPHHSAQIHHIKKHR